MSSYYAVGSSTPTVGSSANYSGTVTGANIAAGAAGTIGWVSRTQLTAPVDGVLRITKADGSTTAAESGIVIGTVDNTATGVALARNAAGAVVVLSGDRTANRGILAGSFGQTLADGAVRIGTAAGTAGLAISSNAALALVSNSVSSIVMDTTGEARMAVKARFNGATDCTITSGTAAPTATEPAGSLYMRTGGAVGARLYVSAGAGAWNAVPGV